MSKAFKPRRSVLFVPGSSARMLEKARTLHCDVVVLDLEDSVAPENKAAARDAVRHALMHGDAWTAREIVIRINSRQTEWGLEDAAMVGSVQPDAVLLPKIDHPDDMEGCGTREVWAMIETPFAILNLPAIAGTMEIDGSLLSTLVMGSNDLLTTMRGQSLPDRRNLWAALSQTVIAARAHGLSAIDGTYNEIGDDAGFTESCGQGRAFGFDGKTLIHPDQIEICNRVFAPSVAEIAQARRVLEAFTQNPGKGAIALDGRMVERLHAEEARRLLALADAIESRT